MKKGRVWRRLVSMGLPLEERRQVLAVLEEEGITWDPEAPELPGRLEAVYGYCQGTVIRVKTRSNEVLFSARCQTGRSEAILREALRRYNAVGRIADLASSEPTHQYVGYTFKQGINEVTHRIQMILDEEGVTR